MYKNEENASVVWKIDNFCRKDTKTYEFSYIKFFFINISNQMKYFDSLENNILLLIWSKGSIGFALHCVRHPS